MEIEAPMGRLIAAELRKTRTRWLPWILLLVLLLGAGAQVWLFGYTAWWDLNNETDPEVRDDLPTAIRTFVLPWAIPTLLDAGQFWGSLIVGILKAGRLITEGPVAEIKRQSSSTIELMTTDDARALDVLRAVRWAPAPLLRDGRIVVEAPPERAADISRALGEAGIWLREMRTAATSLEDFFLEVTGDRDRGAHG